MQGELVDAVRRIIWRELGRPQTALDMDTRAEDVEGWDSHVMIRIILMIEAEFHFEFTGREMDDLRSVGDLVGHVQRRAGRARLVFSR